jgi:hypothetical protein
MSSAISSVTDVVSDVIGAGGEIVKGGVDVLGNVVETGGDFVSDVGKVVSDLDIEDAVTTYIMTGGTNPYAVAFAATSGDEKLGFNPAVFYDPTGGGFGFADPNVYGGGMPGVPSYPGQSIIEPFATQAITALARSALEQDQPTQQQFANIANLSLEGLEKLQGMIASGEYEKTPSLTFYDAERPTSDIISRYQTAKANLNNIINPPGLLGKSGEFGIYEDYFKQRGLI